MVVEVRSLVVLLVLCSSAAAEQLPELHEYHRPLREYIGEQQADDFDVELKPLVLQTDYSSAEPDVVYRDYIGLRGAAGRGARNTVLRTDSRHFTLAAIESPHGVRCFHAPEEAAWWVQLEVPGNPFYGSAGAKRRAAVMAMVNMMMFDVAWDDPTFYRRADGIASNMVAWAYAYRHVKDVLPPETQNAFELGLRHHLQRMLKYGPRDINTNMDTREVVALALLDGILMDPGDHSRLVQAARRILFGRHDRTPDTSDGTVGIFHPAGYIGEADGPETSYNGISLYHLLEARAITNGQADWDAFLPEVIDRMLVFKAHNTFEDPDGYRTGPSNWSKRTNNPYPQDQRARPWRAVAAAMLSEHGHDLAKPVPDRATMVQQIQRAVKQINRWITQPDDTTPNPWRKHVTDWPADLVYTYDHYVPGTYDRRQQQGPAVLPVHRSGDRSTCFDGEFWFCKHQDYAFLVESVADMGHAYDRGGTVGGLAGGSLGVFWTRPAGSLIVSRLPDKWDLVTWETVADWPVHHLWGRDAGGQPFSTARNRRTFPMYDDSEDPREVFLRGSIGPSDSLSSVAPGCLISGVYYERTFTRTEHGLRIRVALRMPFDQVRMTELWETLPVFLKDVSQKAQKETTIAMRTSGEWNDGTVQEFHEQVEAIRLTRFGHSAEIHFEQPQRVRVAKEIWKGGYQNRNRIRNVSVDLLPESVRRDLALQGSAPSKNPVPRLVEFSYEIRSAGAL